MNTIELNMKQRFNVGDILGDTQGVLDAAMEMVGRHKDDDPKTFKVLIEYLKMYGISVRKLSNGIAVVFWLDDDRADAVLGATLEELPEFLTNEDYGVRLLAVHRLEELNEYGLG